MSTIGIDFGSRFCRLAYMPAGSPHAEELGPPISPWQALGNAPTYPYMVIKSTLRPVETLIQVFQMLRREAESRLNQPVEACAVGIPVDSGNQYREQLRSAVTRAGFTSVNLISEPAALVYSQYDRIQAKRPILIYLLGESALTLSIYDIEANNLIEVASRRSEQISGKALTRRLAERLMEKLAEGPVQGPSVNLWLAEAERLKINLSTSGEERVMLPPASLSPRWRQAGSAPVISRQWFEEGAQELLKQSLPLCEELLASVKLKPEDMGDLWLEGGSQAIPLLRRSLADWFGRGPILLSDFAIACGCARQAARLAGLAKPREASPAAPPARIAEAINEVKPVIHLPAPQAREEKTSGALLPITAIWQAGEQRLANGDFEGALKELEQADVLLKKQRGVIFYRAGQAAEDKALQPSALFDLLENAANYYRRAVDMDADNDTYKQARQRVEEYIKHQRAREKYQNGRRFEHQKKWYEATENYRSAYLNDPSQDEYRHCVARGLMMQANERLQMIGKELAKKGRRDNFAKWVEEIHKLMREARKIAPDDTIVNEGEASIRKALQQLGRQ